MIAFLREFTIGVGIFFAAIYFLWFSCYCFWKMNGGGE